MKRLTRVQRQESAASVDKDGGGLDFFAIPETRKESSAAVGTEFRPIKRPVTIRLDEDVLDWLKGYGPGYQTRANLLLRHAMMRDTGDRREP